MIDVSDVSDPEALPESRGRFHELRQSRRWIFGTMLFSALISLTASFVLSVDAIALARDPAATLACNINSVISCGAVGLSWQASLLGFPNAFLGLIAENEGYEAILAVGGGTPHAVGAADGQLDTGHDAPFSYPHLPGYLLHQIWRDLLAHLLGREHDSFAEHRLARGIDQHVERRPANIELQQ